MRAFLVVVLTATLLFSCSTERGEKPDYGIITFELDDSTQVVLETGPLELGKPITIKNSVENIVLRPVSETVFSVPVFGGSISGRWNQKNSSFIGVWTDSLRTSNYTVPVKIIASKEPITSKCVENADRFAWNTTEGRLVADVMCGRARATFLTPTGDLRFLSGHINDKSLKLVTFDGAHLFHITADIYGDSLVNGVFKSGNHYVGAWSGVRVLEPQSGHGSLQLPELDSEIRFEGVNAVGDTVVWNLEAIKRAGKRGLVVDVLGTWCPNCSDEIQLLKTLYKNNPDVVFLSMAFERKDLEHSLRRIVSYKEELEVGWEVLYGGKASKSAANEAMPFLGGVRSFPTTAFVSAQGDIIVHTGFNGPATGPLYEEEKRFFEKAVKEL